MRKTLLAGLVVMLALALTAPPARAVTLPATYLRASVVDRSNLFGDTDLNGTFETARVPGFPILVGDENRTVVSIDAINYGAPGFDGAGVLQIRDLSPIQGVNTYTNDELNGMWYDMVIDPASLITVPPVPTAPFPSTLLFRPGLRYTNAGGVHGTWIDTAPGGGGFLATTAGGFGGLMVLYEDLGATDFNPGGAGPAAWTEGSVVTGDPSLPTSDGFPTISDVVPWLIAVLGPMPAAYGLPPQIVAVESLSLDALGFEANSGLAFANIIGGTAAAMFQMDTFGLGLDIRIEFEPELLGTPYDGWQTKSDDPTQFAIIPEPASLSLLGLSLLGLAVARWRKK